MKKTITSNKGAYFCLYLILINTAFAQSQGVLTSKGESNFWNLLFQGGLLIYPLILLSFLTVVLILFYFLTIRRSSVVTSKFMSLAENLIRTKDYSGMLNACSRSNQAVARIFQQSMDFVIKNPGVEVGEVKSVTQTEGERQANILANRISYLADISAIAPMVGLLGTVIGMIKSFNELGQTVGILQNKLSGGVAEALITTASGLVIGIVALIFYSFFRGRVQKLIAEMEAASTHLIAIFSASYNPFEREKIVNNNFIKAERIDNNGFED